MMLRGLLLIVVLILALPACAPVIVAGAGTAAVSAHDRRTLGAQIDDETVEIKARSALSADESLRGRAHLNITSVNGIVLLTGETETPELRDEVLAKIRDIAGIRRTVNEIRIAEPSGFSARSGDTWLTTKVKSKLIHTDDLDSMRVKVITENKAVYLMGLVSQEEAERATQAARSVGGVDRVVKLFEYLD